MTLQRRVYEESFRRYAVEEIEDGGLSQADAAAQYELISRLDYESLRRSINRRRNEKQLSSRE